MLVIQTSTHLIAGPNDVPSEESLGEEIKRLAENYSRAMEKLRTRLLEKIPKADSLGANEIQQLIRDDSLDDDLLPFVILHEATPKGLASFASKGIRQRKLVDLLLADAALMKEMLIADGAKAERTRGGFGPAQYGPCIEIYDDLQSLGDQAPAGVLRRLALAISLEHAVPIDQSNPESDTDAVGLVNPISRFEHYRDAYLNGELDRAFQRLTTWELRMVVDGDEPDVTLSWGREMLRNFRPDHVMDPSDGWRYVSIVGSNVKYGSECVKDDRPELQKYQNILMNGGVCGRRAFFGRFILRSFGVPTIARPSRGHGALAHWTPDGWVVNLGGGWGAGWTNTLYRDDIDFLKNTQARLDAVAFTEVKRAHWIGDLFGEARAYGRDDSNVGFWNGVALRRQQAIIDQGSVVALDALGEELAEADEPVASRSRDLSTALRDDQVQVEASGKVIVPAAAFLRESSNQKEVMAMNGFEKGTQIFLPRFFPKGLTMLRGGTWKGDPEACTSGHRMLSGGYGRYENWGLRAAMTIESDRPSKELTLQVSEGVSIEFVLIPAGTFVMGGESSTDGRFQCVELPKHEVELTQAFYLGKYEVTQGQYESVMSTNPSRSSKGKDFPVDNVSEADALAFCGKLAAITARDVRLPTEAEWEYASRAGTSTTWFFGDDPSVIGDFAWFKDNADAHSHVVGLKKPNPWGLYDIYGNVCERISDKYERSYYSESPRVDPTGPSPGTHSHLEYRFHVAKAGRYALTANAVTVNYDQRLNVSVRGTESNSIIELPFTNGTWDTTSPVVVTLVEGENQLKLWRDQPPQYGVALDRLILTPLQ